MSFLYRCAWFVVLGALLVACGGTAIPGETPSPPSPEPTVNEEGGEVADPTATAAQEVQQWQAAPILVVLYRTPGFVPPEIVWSRLPDLMLYRDGRVITARQEMETQVVEEGQLSPAEVCEFLEQFEQEGFFDFDMAAYQPPPITDVGGVSILVDAWEARQVDAYALDVALSEDEAAEGVEVPEELVTTYRRLENYEPPNAQPYQPERIALLIRPATTREVGDPWPFDEPSLTSLVEGASAPQNEVVLEGDIAAEVYRLFDGRFTNTFQGEDESTFQVTMRPLLPLETAEGVSQGWLPPAPNLSEPTQEMQCPPAEG